MYNPRGQPGMNCMWPYPPPDRYPHYRDYYHNSHKLQPNPAVVSTSSPLMNNVETLSHMGGLQGGQPTTTILQSVQQPIISQGPVLQQALTQGITQSSHAQQHLIQQLHQQQLHQQQLHQQQQLQHQLQTASTPVVLSSTLQTVLTAPTSNTHSSLHNNITSSPAQTIIHSEPQPNKIIPRMRLQDLVREVDPNEQIDDEVEEILLQMADDFVESCVTASCVLAKHRKSNSVDVKDVQLHLERNWNMWIPGFGTDELKPYKKSSITEAHKQRLQLIKKTLKKY